MEISTITKEELSNKIDQKEDVQIVNVLDPKYYDLGFISGSLAIPLAEIDERLGELDKNKEVIVYCASYECDASRKAAQKLENAGFAVRAYEGGIKEWKAARLPSEIAARAA